MRDDAVSLPSKMKHQRARKTPNGLTPNHISNIRVAAEAADIEIHEHFKFRLETYKTWAYCISRKSSSDYVFRLSITENTYNVRMSTMLLVINKTVTGPTLDAFRELIAVLCGGTRGTIPYLDFLADFSEATRFKDKVASETIVKLVKEIFNLSSDAPSATSDCSSSASNGSQSTEVTRSGELSSLNQTNGLDSATFSVETPRERMLGDSAENERVAAAHGEGPSVSSLCNGIVRNADMDSASVIFFSSPSMNKSHGDISVLKSPGAVKPKRDIYAIRSRKVGRAGSYSISGECFVCGKGGDLISCGRKYSGSTFCTTKFHKKCIEAYNAAEYSVDCLRKIVDETICPLHFCSTCYLERWKTTAVRGKLIECDSCFRGFHEQCCPAGFELYEDVVPARTKEGSVLEVKQTFTRCHSHCDFQSIPLVENKRSHLPFCCECENAGEEPLLKCSQCVRSFHESCLTLNCWDLHNNNPKPLCESCILGETLRIGQSQDKAAEEGPDSSENVTKKRKKRSGKAVLPQEPPEKKTKSGSRRKVSSPVDHSPPSTGSSSKEQNNVTLNGRVNRPTVTFRKASSSSRSDKNERELPKAVRRSRNRRPKTLNGLKDHTAENESDDSLLTRVLLKGEALEARSSSSASPQRSNEVIEGLKRTRQIAVELSPSNLVM
ncbi:hypothetical protein GCK32_008575 [Trichostrongylus colubriformis]|uniref:Zinc finger PHD-type domain-containing protein n=1 Tax=Trichostrongylus colubriformis TaxID=6319 RepID=A0AAN8FLS7_TRICO